MMAGFAFGSFGENPNLAGDVIDEEHQEHGARSSD
jgi:hypothetical protein